MAKFYRDEQGNLYSVDRETGERTLIEPASGNEETGDVGGPDNADDEAIEE